MFNPVNHGGVVNSGDALDRAKAAAVDVHTQTDSSNVIAVSSMRIGVEDKLTTAINTDVILLSFLLTVLADVARLAFRTIHSLHPFFLIPQLCNAWKPATVRCGLVIYVVLLVWRQEAIAFFLRIDLIELHGTYSAIDHQYIFNDP